jgi:RHH-type proline utilization regulon transcriptional repressor/proline dehydrogenase/delta 1-pyrroline-5-carboxylate dehydrogenase
MLAAENIRPAFASHNALTVATILEWAGNSHDFEFQRLHGMGDGLYERLVREQGHKCRIYAPVGGHRDLLAYLVRRLLENGANSASCTGSPMRG